MKCLICSKTEKLKFIDGYKVEIKEGIKKLNEKTFRDLGRIRICNISLFL